MIEPTTLDNAILEAERFLEKARTYQKRIQDPDSLRRGSPYWSGVAEHAAVKRSSMDLTRILADLRQNR